MPRLLGRRSWRVVRSPLCTPKYHRGVRKPRTSATSGSLGEDPWLPWSSNFDPLQGGDPVPSRRHQFLVQEPGPITGAKFFKWQQLPDEQIEEHTASYTSEVASFAVAGITGTAGVAPNPEGNGVKSTVPGSSRKARQRRGCSAVRSGSW